jgi:hypothetical protein
MIKAEGANRAQMTQRSGDGPDYLWLRNGPGYPFDLCIDFSKDRILLLTAVTPDIGGRGAFGFPGMTGDRGWKSDYMTVEELTADQRLAADKGSVVIPFDRVIRLALSKPWGRPPILLVETDAAGTDDPLREARQVRRHEFMLSSKRRQWNEQVSRIRQALPASALAKKFEDRIKLTQ